ncbi:MAG: sugar phosphate isomerase/epimerase, partial [Clostridia bacterium]|nr:sugar phosphate isomerase/epimerase [Clostridia bacterium]
MKLCYQVATPDVAVSPAVTAYQGPLETSFSELARLGYDGVELMTISPDLLDWKHVRRVADDNGL